MRLSERLKRLEDKLLGEEEISIPREQVIDIGHDETDPHAGVTLGWNASNYGLELKGRSGNGDTEVYFVHPDHPESYINFYTSSDGNTWTMYVHPTIGDAPSIIFSKDSIRIAPPSGKNAELSSGDLLINDRTKGILMRDETGQMYRIKIISGEINLETIT